MLSGLSVLPSNVWTMRVSLRGVPTSVIAPLPPPEVAAPPPVVAVTLAPPVPVFGLTVVGLTSGSAQAATKLITMTDSSRTRTNRYILAMINTSSCGKHTARNRSLESGHPRVLVPGRHAGHYCLFVGCLCHRIFSVGCSIHRFVPFARRVCPSRSARAGDGVLGDGAQAAGDSGASVVRALLASSGPGPGERSSIRTACNACSSRSGGSVLLMKASALPQNGRLNLSPPTEGDDVQARPHGVERGYQGGGWGCHHAPVSSSTSGCAARISAQNFGRIGHFTHHSHSPTASVTRSCNAERTAARGSASTTRARWIGVHWMHGSLRCPRLGGIVSYSGRNGQSTA